MKSRFYRLAARTQGEFVPFGEPIVRNRELYAQLCSAFMPRVGLLTSIGTPQLPASNLQAWPGKGGLTEFKVNAPPLS